MSTNPMTDKRYTYADLKQWETPEGSTWELINGIPYLLARPSQNHQRILRRVIRIFDHYLAGKKCEAMLESEVNLSFIEDEDLIDKLVVPDLYVTCHPEYGDGQKFNGSPELIIEILSTNAKHDKWEKYLLYQKSGVKEYWIIDPYNNTIEIYLLDAGKYELKGVFNEEDTMKVNLFEDLEIEVKDIFI